MGGNVAQFCWWVQCNERVDDAPAPTEEVQKLFVPDGISFLRIDADAAALAKTGKGIRFETLSRGGRDALLMETPAGGRVRVDGGPAPRLAVLDVKSEVQLEAAVLHLTRFDAAEVGPPPPELVGAPCALCTVEFAADSTVRVHDCGQGFHQDPESVPEAIRLECALLSDSCAHCGGTLAREPGFSWRPF